MISEKIFLDPLVVMKDDQNGIWTVMQPFDYESMYLHGVVIHVPIGMTTDFASIPKLFWSVLAPAEGKYAKAAVVHDCLYHAKGHVEGLVIPRSTCDKILLEAMTDMKTPRWQKFFIYVNVRLFGWIAWSKENG